mmetsp:Transcript_17874/g.53718  ORF Transcript_17874/g.53718 Transcript_17874/m.53718 type:complete len:132 (-) Transcript_17874:460-855(-)
MRAPQPRNRSPSSDAERGGRWLRSSRAHFLGERAHAESTRLALDSSLSTACRCHRTHTHLLALANLYSSTGARGPLLPGCSRSHIEAKTLCRTQPFINSTLRPIDSQHHTRIDSLHCGGRSPHRRTSTSTS